MPKFIEVEGPPLKIKPHVDNFKKMHKKTIIKNRKIYAIEERKFINPEELLKDIIKSEFVRERSKLIKIDVL